MRNFQLLAVIGALSAGAIGCESGVPTGPGNVTITETTTTTTTIATTTIPVPLTSKFTFSPITPRATADEVMFDGSESTTGPDRRIINYDWHFGDGHTGDGPTPKHIYGEEGIFLITLIVEDDKGGSGRSSQPITVRPAPMP
jgi:PKD repeat protein